MTNSSPNSLGSSSVHSLKSAIVSNSTDVAVASSDDRFVKRLKRPPQSMNILNPILVPDPADQTGPIPSPRPTVDPTNFSNGVSWSEAGGPSSGPVGLDKGKGKATQSQVWPSNGNNYVPKWKRGGRRHHLIASVRTENQQIPPVPHQGDDIEAAAEGSESVVEKLTVTTELATVLTNSTTDDNNNNNKSSKKFLREMTTDTVAFENFSSDMKWSNLYRRISQLEVELGKREKYD
ncbi:hypothetical protein F4804DRAFT_326501 [Jackrogersella minutella]|nr:hypothetical protein F4804DRAFT_326501 [Jackrogersella minutella]